MCVSVMYKNTYGVRTRVVGQVIELWLGEPGHGESDILMAVHEDYLDSILNQLLEVHKAPRLTKSGDLDRRRK